MVTVSSASLLYQSKNVFVRACTRLRKLSNSWKISYSKQHCLLSEVKYINASELWADNFHHFVKEKKKSNTWHVTCHMWSVTCYTWHVKHDMWYMICDTWHVTGDRGHVGGGEEEQSFLALMVWELQVTPYMWQMTCDTWHVACVTYEVVKIMSKLQVPSFNGLRAMMVWRLGEKGWLNESMSNNIIWCVCLGKPYGGKSGLVMEFFHKGGGGLGPTPKFLGTFFVSKD